MRFTVLSALAAAAAVILMSMPTPSLAGAVPTPEIDPGTIAAGVGVLAAGVLVLRARRGSK